MRILISTTVLMIVLSASLFRAPCVAGLPLLTVCSLLRRWGPWLVRRTRRRDQGRGLPRHQVGLAVAVQVDLHEAAGRDLVAGRLRRAGAHLLPGAVGRGPGDLGPARLR